jgi:hypothetical protein
MSKYWADDQMVGGTVPSQLVDCIAKLWSTRHCRNPNRVGAAIGFDDVVSGDNEMSAITFIFGLSRKPMIKIARRNAYQISGVFNVCVGNCNLLEGNSV